MRNPFTPTFGVSPPLLVGRNAEITAFEESLDDGVGSPGRATLYTGIRGTGKTVMLNEAGRVARERGWVVIDETADAALIERLERTILPTHLAEWDPAAKGLQIRGISGPMGVGVSWDSHDTHSPQPGLREQLAALCALLAEHETGVLLTIDEITPKDVAPLRRFAAVIQHLFREGYDVAVAGAGLPSAVDAILNADAVTFFQRAERMTLGPVPLDEVKAALAEPITRGGREIAATDAERASEATGGYPFLIQLVGHHIWRQNPHTAEISADDVTRGIEAAHRRLGSLVFEPTLKGLSEIDRTFLMAMAQDDGPSQVSDIASRLGVAPNYVSVYRARLVSAGVIVPAGRGRVDFVTARLREYLREHVAFHAQPGDPE